MSVRHSPIPLGRANDTFISKLALSLTHPTALLSSIERETGKDIPSPMTVYKEEIHILQPLRS